MPSRKIPIPREKKKTQPTKKNFNLPENFSIPLKFLNHPEISQFLLKVSQPPKISQPYQKNPKPSRKNLNPSRKQFNPS